MPLIVVRVTAEALTVDEFVARFARYFRDGEVVFVPTEGVQPSGRRVRFVFALKTGQELVVGEGVVMRMRRDSGDPRRPPGMELRYELADDASRELVARMIVARQTPPPYVSMRVDGVSESQQVTIPHEKIEPLPAMVEHPPIAPPDEASRGWRLVGVGLATAAAMLAMAIAMAMIRRATPVIPPASAPPPVVAGPRPASTGGARPPPAPPRPRPAARPIELHVTTSPTGSTVFVDGEERGPSPLTITVAAGAHDVVAERPRWRAAHAHVDSAGRVQLVLERPSAHLRITSPTPGASVRLDGRDVGVTPLELDASAYEEHHLRIELDGRVWKRKIYLRPPGRVLRFSRSSPLDTRSEQSPQASARPASP